jgi:hypothetical protein
MRGRALVVASLIVAAVAAASASPQCEWGVAPRRSLSADARQAEEIAIRFADATAGRRSGRYSGAEAYQAARERCLTVLAEEVGRAYDASEADVRRSLEVRDWQWDAFVMLSFLAFYVFGSVLVARATSAGYSTAAALAAAVPIALAAVAVGELWANAMEMFRVGNSHLSYRVTRVPWQHHRPALFGIAVVLFGAIALWRRVRPRTTDSLTTTVYSNSCGT